MLYFDLETTNLDKGSALNVGNRCLMVAWAVDDGPVRTHVGPLLEAKDFWDDYDSQTEVCAQNAKFEMHWLMRYVETVHDKSWHDTMLAEYVLSGNRRLPLDLGSIAARHGQKAKDPVIDRLMKLGVCPSEMPLSRLKARCIRDVSTMREIHKRQMKLIDARGQRAVYTTRRMLAPVLMEIEREGMILDAGRVREVYKQHCEELREVERELDQLTGNINLRSTDQVATFLYDKLKFPERKDSRGKVLRNKPSKRWPEGKPLTDKATLAWLAKQAKTEKQKRFIELRSHYGKLNAALTKNLDFFNGVCDNYAGMFRARINQTVTATHRLSSSGVPIELEGIGKRSAQFQNMPREFKRLFKAPVGYYLVEADFPQLEFRVAAYLGKDKQALEDIQNPKFDAHVKSASVMTDTDYDTLYEAYMAGDSEAKQLRQSAKADTFKPLFGGTRGTDAQEKWYKEFQNRYSGIYAAQEKWLAEVLTHPEAELALPWGIRFRWPFRFNRNGVAISKVTGKPIGPSVANYPIQSLATAEIAPIAFTELFNVCRESNIDVRFINTVHDSIICLVKKEDYQVFEQNVKWAFTTAVYKILRESYGLTDWNVPLGVEITRGSHWGEGEVTKYDDVHEGGHLV